MAGKKKSRRMSLRDFSRELPTEEDRERFHQAVDGQSDMVTAIISAIEVDFVLERAIIAHFERKDDATAELLTRENGPLATFSAKIALGYAMGLYDQELMDSMNLIRKIRNAFAHSRRDISFATPEVSAEFAALKMPQDTGSDRHRRMELVKRLAAVDARKYMEKDEVAESCRSAFVLLCYMVVVEVLHGQAALATEEAEGFRRRTLLGALRVLDDRKDGPAVGG